MDSDAKKRAKQKAALKKIEDGGIATKVRVLVTRDACPVCRALDGAYAFENAPELPPEGCSCIGGCRSQYAPVLDMRGP